MAKKSGLQIGDRVKLVNCYEARSGKYDGVVFTVANEPRVMCDTEVARLESESKNFPTFATEFLERIS